MDLKFAEDRIRVERDCTSWRYCGVLQSVCGIVETFLSSASPSWDWSRVGKLQRELKTKELNLHTLPDIAAENKTLRTEVRYVRSSTGAIDRYRIFSTTLPQTVRNFTQVLEKEKTGAKLLRKRNSELEIDVRKKRMLATMNSARVRALSRELEIVVSKSAASRSECVNSGWDARCVIKNVSGARVVVKTRQWRCLELFSTWLNKKSHSSDWNQRTFWS